MAGFTEPPKTTDPIEILRYFQQKADRPKSEQTGIASKPDTGDKTDSVMQFFADWWTDSEEKVAKAREELAPDMQELARRSSEEAALFRMEEGITQSLPTPGFEMRIGEAGTLPMPDEVTVSGLDGERVETSDISTAVDAAVAQALSGTEEATTGGGLMSRPTAQERSAVSARGDDISVSQGYKITDDEGTFSSAALGNALSKTIRNPIKKALIEGMSEVEVAGNGPVTETGYSRANVAAMSPNSAWGRRLVRDGIMTPNGGVTDQYSADNVFNSVYANRLGNGDYASGDGSRFKGRGLLQLTGRTTYQEVQNRLQAQGMDVNLVQNPELVNDMKYALPAALAYLDYKGLDDERSEAMTAKGLNNLINSGADADTAKHRWDAAVSALRSAGKEDEAAAMALRNEYTAQETVGLTGRSVDGDIGPSSRRAIRAWATRNDVTIPEDASDTDLVIIVNKNS